MYVDGCSWFWAKKTYILFPIKIIINWGWLSSAFYVLKIKKQNKGEI